MEKPTDHPLWPAFEKKMQEYNLHTPKLLEACWVFCFDMFLAGAVAERNRIYEAT